MILRGKRGWWWCLSLVLVVCCATTTLGQGIEIDGHKTSATVWLDPDTQQIHFSEGIRSDPHVLAWGTFDKSHVNSTGWGKLTIETSPAAQLKGHNSEAFFALGLLEGALTCEEIHQFYVSRYIAHHYLITSAITFLFCRGKAH